MQKSLPIGWMGEISRRIEEAEDYDIDVEWKASDGTLDEFEITFTAVVDIQVVGEDIDIDLTSEE